MLEENLLRIRELEVLEFIDSAGAELRQFELDPPQLTLTLSLLPDTDKNASGAALEKRELSVSIGEVSKNVQAPSTDDEQDLVGRAETYIRLPIPN